MKAEYLYADFGSVSSTSNMNAFTVPSPPNYGPSVINHSADFTVQTARVGLNYKF